MKCKRILLLSALLCNSFFIESASYLERFTNLFSGEDTNSLLAQLQEALSKGTLQDLMRRYDFSLDPALVKRLTQAGFVQLTQPLTPEAVDDLIIRLRNALAPTANAFDRRLLTDVARSLVKKFKHYFTFDRQVQLGAEGLAKLIAMLKQRGELQQGLQRLGISFTGLAQGQALSNLRSGVEQVAKTDAAIKLRAIAQKLFDSAKPLQTTNTVPSYWQQYGKPVVGFTSSALSGLGGLASSGIGLVGTYTGLSDYMNPQIIELINRYPQLRNTLLGLLLAGAGTYGSYRYYMSGKPLDLSSVIPKQEENESTKDYVARLRNLLASIEQQVNLGAKSAADLQEVKQKTIDQLSAKIQELERQELPWYRRWFMRPSPTISSQPKMAQPAAASGSSNQPKVQQKSTTKPEQKAPGSSSSSSSSASSLHGVAQQQFEKFAQDFGKESSTLSSPEAGPSQQSTSQKRESTVKIEEIKQQPAPQKKERVPIEEIE